MVVLPDSDYLIASWIKVHSKTPHDLQEIPINEKLKPHRINGEPKPYQNQAQRGDLDKQSHLLMWNKWPLLAVGRERGSFLMIFF